LDVPLADRELLLAALRQVVSPMLAELREDLKACGQVRLWSHCDDGNTWERTRTFLFPTADEALVMRALGQLLDNVSWQAAVITLAVALEQIQDIMMEQLALFPFENERERKLWKAQRYLVARFGTSRLQRTVIAQPGAPLPEWRVGWLLEEEE
jgi:hypothetical protein